MSTSQRAEDVRAYARLRYSGAAELNIRGVVRQKPDGSVMDARMRITESVGSFRQRRKARMVVVDGRLFARGSGRWRRIQDTSPHFSYDEALALARRATDVERVSSDHLRADVDVGHSRGLEPLGLLGGLEDGMSYEATVNVLLDARGRVRRLTLSVDSREQQDVLKASVKALAFNEGLEVHAPSN